MRPHARLAALLLASSLSGLGGSLFPDPSFSRPPPCDSDALPHRFADTRRLSAAEMPLPADELQRHGTTTLSFVWGDCVVVGVDSRASMGSYVGSRTTKKLFPIGTHAVATMAGGAADCTYWLRRLARSTALLEHQHNTRLSVRAVAKQLADALREHRGSELSVGTMVAGVDAHGPSIFYVDSEGACVRGQCFCVGSGQMLAYAVLDQRIEALRANASATAEDAAQLALWAVRTAAHRDGFSGGFINVFVIDQRGVRHALRRDSRAMPMSPPPPSAGAGKALPLDSDV